MEPFVSGKMGAGTAISQVFQEERKTGQGSMTHKGMQYASGILANGWKGCTADRSII